MAPLRGAAKRAASKRGGRPKLLDVALLNSSGRPQLRLAHDHCRAGKFVGPGCLDDNVPVAAFLGQETHAAGSDWTDLKNTLKGAGWKTMGAPASSAHSTGASISVRSAYGVGLTQGAREDNSPPESPGRLATAWVDGIVRGGVLLILI